eukprot:265951-Rhodomonas_salina.1
MTDIRSRSDDRRARPVTTSALHHDDSLRPVSVTVSVSFPRAVQMRVSLGNRDTGTPRLRVVTTFKLQAPGPGPT